MLYEVITNDKNPRSWFSSSWMFAILLLTFIVFQLLFSGKYTQKAGQREIEEMVMHHDIEKVVVINEEQAEIYIKPDSLKSGRYPDFAEHRSFGLQPPKPQFYVITSYSIHYTKLYDSSFRNLFFGGSI